MDNHNNDLLNKTSSNKKPSGLGKGLSALLGNNAYVNPMVEKKVDPKNVVDLSVDNIFPSKFQPRTHFKEEQLNELSLSIKEKGVLQPILVRKNQTEDNKYELVAGERRWRASKLANLNVIPALIVDFSDQEVLEVGLIENLQRQELNPIEEAKAFYQLIKDFNYTHNDLAKTISKDRSYITNYLRVLTLPLDIQKLIEAGKLSVGHAKIIVNYEYPMELAEKIIAEKLSVRDTESLAKVKKLPASYKREDPDADISAPEQELLKEVLAQLTMVFEGFKPQLKLNNNGSGFINLKFNNVEALHKLQQLLSNN